MGSSKSEQQRQSLDHRYADPCNTAGVYCEHMIQEGVRQIVANPLVNLPAVVCSSLEGVGTGSEDEGSSSSATGAGAGKGSGSASSCTHFGPHVHCVFCLHEAAAKGIELTDGPQSCNSAASPALPPFMLHFHEKQEERKSITSHEDDDDVEYVLVGSEIVARKRSFAMRHACFVAAVGSTAMPIVVVYCAACDCFAPLATFQRADMSDEELALSGKGSATLAKSHGQHEDYSSEFTTSTESVEVVLTRLLLACHVWSLAHPASLRLKQQQQPKELHEENQGGKQTGALSEPALHYLFLASPFTFGEDEEALNEAIEEGCEVTHCSAILPDAVVRGAKGHPTLHLLRPPSETLERVQSQIERAVKEGRSAEEDPTVYDEPTALYRFNRAVVGFAIGFPSQEMLHTRVAMALRQSNALRDVIALVYVEDVEKWVLAHVLSHHRHDQHHRCRPSASTRPTLDGEDEESVEIGELYNDPTDATQAVRNVCNKEVMDEIPEDLHQQLRELTLSTRQQSVEEDDEQMENLQSHKDSSSCADADENDPIARFWKENCPLSAESRNVDFLLRAMAIAKAIAAIP